MSHYAARHGFPCVSHGAEALPGASDLATTEWMLRRTLTRHRRAVARGLLIGSSVGWLAILHAGGCANGSVSDDGATGAAGGDAAPEGSATASEGGSRDDANQTASGEGGEDAGSDGGGNNLGDDSGENSVPDATSDAVADASTPLEASTGDAAADAGFDGGTLRDAAPPADAGCTTTTSCGIQALCVSGICTASRRVFVSTERFTGNLGGTSGADGSCQSIANGAQLGGTWKAWVSDGTTSPSTRFTQASVGYRLLDGTLLAANWTGLVGGALLHGIDLTEQRTTIPDSQVWTGTLSTGVAIGTNVCNGFTSSANGATQAVVGDTTRTDIGWSNATSQSCDANTLRIYCVEQ